MVSASSSTSSSASASTTSLSTAPSSSPSTSSLSISAYEQKVDEASQAFFIALVTNAPTNELITHFSHDNPDTIVIQHAPASCPNPRASRLLGINAVRSYFDLVATHWTCQRLVLTPEAKTRWVIVDDERAQVITKSCLKWTWKKSGNSWTEEFTCTADYDEHAKITSMIIRTDSAQETCLMRAIDEVS